MSFEQKQYWLKGQEYERERLTKRVNDLINSVVDYGLGPNYPRIKNALLDVIWDGKTPEDLLEPAWTEETK